MGSIYKCTMEPEEEEVLEELRKKISESRAGVTLTGNRLTVRWNKDDTLVDVHMIIESVTTTEREPVNPHVLMCCRMFGCTYSEATEMRENDDPRYRAAKEANIMVAYGGDPKPWRVK